MTVSEFDRIAQMESHLDNVVSHTNKLQDQLNALQAMRAHAKTLFSYYGSEAWYADRDLTLPEGFKAGVLSEDSVYDAITDLRDVAFQMLELGTDILKEWI